MRRAFIFVSLLSIILSACGAAASTPMVVEPSTLAVNTPAPTSTPAPSPTFTITPTVPTSTPAPTATETLLPTLELPTLAVNPPARAVWDGLPTYLADSRPGYYFRVTYDPEVWAQVTDQFGQPALGHRSIPYCIIAPSQGRGLPPTLRVEHEIQYADNLTIDVGRAYQKDVLDFVTYQVSDGIVFTGFLVDFEDQSEACLKDAGAVITSFQSVPVSRATPLPQ